MVASPTTTNYNLPLNVAGHVPLQRAVREGFTTLDTVVAALAARVLALETALNDSNSTYFNGTPG